MRAADVGMPQLSMHSVREMMGAADLVLAGRLFRTFFADWETVDAALSASSTDSSS